MSFSAYPHADLLRHARTLYTGARDVPEATAVLVPDYYASTEDFDAGLARVASMQAQLGTLRSEERDQFEATEDAQQRASEVRALYNAHRRMARRAHDKGSEGYRALHLSGSAPNRRADLYEAAAAFWLTVTQRPDLVDDVRGLTVARAEESLATLEAARQADDAQARETSEAEGAAADLRETVRALRAEAGELAEAARLALAGQPGVLSALGLR